MGVKYRVLVQKHQLKGKAIAKFNDEVDESQLNGNAVELVKAGFVEVVKSEKTEKAVDEIEVKEAKEVKPKK